MKLVNALRIQGPIRLSLVGAGGKTTALFQLAHQVPSPVFLSATTHLAVSQLVLADWHRVVESAADLHGYIAHNQSGIQLFTGPLEADQRTQGLWGDSLDALLELTEAQKVPLFIEADGARQLPLKAPDVHEPAIPEWIQVNVVMAGLSGVGEPLDGNHVHRPEIFAKLSGRRIGEFVSPSDLVQVLNHPAGGLKNAPPLARRVVILNQADTIERQALADWLAKRLLPYYSSVLVASLKEEIVYKVHERVAGIILAAGSSERLGKPKQILDWRGEPFVRHVARAALSAGLSPVVVVVGAAAGEVEHALYGIPVVIVHNEKWSSGQSTSIQAGLSVLPNETGAAVFLLSDQPQVTPSVIKALVTAHSHNLDAIVAPQIDEKRANPVLFDRSVFEELANLEGDTGGRAIFPYHKIDYVPWGDTDLLLDVDTPEDYQRLKEIE